jgi:hypothetical protein
MGQIRSAAMTSAETMPTRFRRAGATATLLLILAACGNDDPRAVASEETQTHPTAVELADAEGGTVSQYPGFEYGGLDNARYCIENTGTIVGISLGNDESVTCRVGNENFGLLTDRKSDETLGALCQSAGGQVVGVAVAVGEDFNVPACHIKPLG